MSLDIAHWQSGLPWLNRANGLAHCVSRFSGYYGHLPPGQYAFEAMVGGPDGLWRTAAHTLPLEIVPRYWERRWVQAAAALTVLGLTMIIVWTTGRARLHRRLALLEAQQALERERARIARDIHDDLGSGLTRLAWLGELAGTDRCAPERVELHSHKIVQHARDMVHALNEIVWAVNPRNDTLQSLAQYVTHHVHESFGPTPVNYRLEIPGDLPDLPLTSEVRHHLFLAVKEALHNVLKHSAAKEVHVRFVLGTDELTVIVEDNGCGFDPAGLPATGQHHGLDNLRARIEGLGGTFGCDSAPGQGTRLTFVVPIANGA